ncbi:hypothetical protein KUTeg_014319 [Tegillarca granosa]|uniref:Cell death regulator Aven n=1 Tax=Tegillarca granosa TaxID=220873 RepID=A0ABQ9EZZ6_TEGGR|nr:hypothetical protein KUTeg_014319 [Tegillarca granosa]
MRPDEHKKKRSAQYKKKHGLTKESKEQQDGKINKDRLRSGAHSNQTSKHRTQHEKATESGASNSQKLTSSSGSDSEEEITQHKTYSKRKIVSNWDRYDIPTTEEDKIEHRGEDFTKLLHSAGDAVSQFRFQDEQGWEEEDINTSFGSEFLSIDINNVASSLDCLPLYDRLGLDKNLFSEKQLVKLDKVAEQNKEFYKPSVFTSTSSKTELLLSPTSSTDDAVDFKTIKISSENVKDPRLNSDKSDYNVTLDNDKSNIDKSKLDIVDSVEDELDFLLSLDKPADNSDKGDNSQTATSHIDIEQKKKKDNVVALEIGTKQDKPPAKEIKSETDDLEDWLDSVLDD